MTNPLYRVIPVLCLLCTTQTFAAENLSSRPTGGTIYFTGQIVEPMCETTANIQQQQVEMRCPRNNLAAWSLSSLEQSGAQASSAAVDIRYLDERRKLGILSISYY